MLSANNITEKIMLYLKSLDDIHQKIEFVNEIKKTIHQYGPFVNEPVDCVLWVRTELIEANNYNPNVMASVEKKLLEHSIDMDGFTQPVVVTGQNDKYLIVDGFHRHLTGKNGKFNKRLHGYIPVTLINSSSMGERERIAATIRHNRARGKHQISAMSDIVRDLCRLGWNDQQIALELGMSADEVLRLKQISGLTELFSDEEFSNAWTVK